MQYDPIVETCSGRVRGMRDGPVSVFRGIPYGGDTARARRWLPPEPPAPWKDIRDATAQGPICPQIVGAPLAEEAAMLQRGPMSEDCLTLAVWTPAPDAGRRPVMVWYHGGGFANGSGGAAPYDGRNLCAKQNVVLVTVTHRLNVFGFLDLEAAFGPAYAGSGNIGLLDCVAALRWVRDNIAAFGGDPDNVTIFGQSGGGAKVAAMMAMPDADGLFQRAIVQSAPAIVPDLPESAAAKTETLLDALGTRSLTQLQALPADRLIEMMVASGIRLGPVRDGRVLPVDMSVASPVSGDVPLLCGTTRHEATFFPGTPIAPISDAEARVWLETRFPGHDVGRIVDAVLADRPDTPPAEILQIVASMAFGAGVLAQAERKAQDRRTPVFLYYFIYKLRARDGALGATHTAEIPFVFDSLANAEALIGPATPADRAVAEAMSACWAGFARTGNPGPEGIVWPPFDSVTRPVMTIGDHFELAHDPMGRTRIMLDRLAAG